MGVRRATIGLFFLAAMFAVASGCGRAQHSGGSNTNWLAPCETDTDCARFGPDIECVSGACLPASARGAAGTGGTDAGGGDSGTGVGGSSGAGGPPSAGVGGSVAGGGATSGGGGATSGSGGDALGGAGGEAGGITVEPVTGRIAVAYRNTCVQSGGNVYCWGSNQLGQLGVPPKDARGNGIVKVPGLSTITQVALADDHGCALTETGDVYCWGDNGVGQIGGESAPTGTCDFDTADLPCQPTPTRVEGVEDVVELAVASRVSCALIRDGSVRCWGETDNLDPWPAAVTSATSVSLGSLGGCATLTNGELACSFELPAPADGEDRVRRLELSKGSDTSAYMTDFGCALRADGGVSCFGDGTLGQLGDHEGTASSAVQGGAVQLAAGAAHACALLSDGRLECWGENWFGAVGGYPLESPTCRRSWNFVTSYDPSSTCETAPRIVEGVPPLVAIGASDRQTCGFAADETLWCWGTGAYAYGAPVRVAGPWEAGGEACASLLAGVVAQNSFTTTPCVTDEDCIAVPLDLPCAHTCDVAPMEKVQAQYLQRALDDVQSTACSALAGAGCPSPEVTCPDKQLRTVCVRGFCAFDDPARTGCTDECACAIERSWKTTDTVCDGFHLWVTDAVNCGQCDGSWVYLAIGNRGASTFDGSVGLSFSGGAPQAPEDRTLSLHLGPGEVSDPIRIDSRGKGYVDVILTAPGDCYEPDSSSEGITWEFPSPSNACD